MGRRANFNGSAEGKGQKNTTTIVERENGIVKCLQVHHPNINKDATNCNNIVGRNVADIEESTDKVCEVIYFHYHL